MHLAGGGCRKTDRDPVGAVEAHVERVTALLRSGIHETQIVAVRKTSPHRAGTGRPPAIRKECRWGTVARDRLTGGKGGWAARLTARELAVKIVSAPDVWWALAAGQR